MKKILMLIICCYSFKAIAQQVVLKSPSVSSHEFNAFMMTQKKSQSYIDFQKKKLVSQKIKLNLTQSFSVAQKSFFSENSAQSIERFKQVLGFKHLADWSRVERSQILHAYMRIFELSDNESEKNTMLKEAVRFSMGMNLNKDIFSPPTVEKYKLAQNEMDTYNWQVPAIWSAYSTALINGKAAPLINGQTLKLPKGRIRVTFLSNSHPAVSRVLHTDELSELRVSTLPLLVGTCNSYELDKSLLYLKTKIYFNAECKPSSKQKITQAIPKLVDLKPKVDFQITDPIQSLRVQKEKSFIQKNWKWLAAGTALVVTGILLSQDKDSGSNTSTKTGF